MCRVQQKGLAAADVEKKRGIKASDASTFRLLYACISPLDARSKNAPPEYGDFLDEMDPIVLQRLRIDHIVRFLRAALRIPDGALFMPLVLIDEGNKAEDFWDHDGEPSEVCRTFACGACSQFPSACEWQLAQGDVHGCPLFCCGAAAYSIPLALNFSMQIRLPCCH